MKRFQPIFAIFCLSIPILACAAFSKPSTVTPAVTPANTLADPDVYNVSSDPAQDLKQTVGIAQKENKRILIEVGGEWCIWCHIMDDFYKTHADLLKLRETNYVLLKVNYSEENKNQAFLAQYPAVPGFPHIFILESDGSFLHSQNTSELEEGQSYNLEKFTAFLQKWAKP